MFAKSRILLYNLLYKILFTLLLEFQKQLLLYVGWLLFCSLSRWSHTTSKMVVWSMTKPPPCFTNDIHCCTSLQTSSVHIDNDLNQNNSSLHKTCFHRFSVQFLYYLAHLSIFSSFPLLRMISWQFLDHLKGISQILAGFAPVSEGHDF